MMELGARNVVNADNIARFVFMSCVMRLIPKYFRCTGVFFSSSSMECKYFELN